MSEINSNEPMLEMYIFETSQLTEQLEKLVIDCEKTDNFTDAVINEIFRIMHTIKGSSAMMLFNNIASVAHSIEDMFFFQRDEKPTNIDCSMLSDLVLEGVDFIKLELEKIKNGDPSDGEAEPLLEKIKDYLAKLKNQHPAKGRKKTRQGQKEGPRLEQEQQYYISANKDSAPQGKNKYKAVIYFKEGCEMENIRAFTVIHHLKEIADEINHFPEDIIENDETVETIRQNGFQFSFRTDRAYQEMHQFLQNTIFLKDMELQQLNEVEELLQVSNRKKIVLEDCPVNEPTQENKECCEKQDKEITISSHQIIISVNVEKLDMLMDLVGEMVISEAMVTQNPDLKGLELENFQKAARQLSKITSEVQDMVMSIRMVPLETTFHKMNRIVRDMCKKLGKEVRLEIIGEETEVDKNIIEHISDPLMHLIRNAIDHGIETPQERLAIGKPEIGTITLEARNAGSDVLVIVRDDGKGLNREKILERARENGLIHKIESEMTEKEIFSLILLPGFSTKEKVTEYSGRGVGMDVVAKNIEAVGGIVTIDSLQEKGTNITLKIPLTLAIIDGMNIRVGNSRYTLPTISIKQSFRAQYRDLITDPDGNEMIMVRGQCYPLLRLHEYYKVKTQVTQIPEGIVVMVENNDKALCIFADELLGEQQVVVKTLPDYIKKTKKIGGLAGCTLLGDGSISLILDVGGLINQGQVS